MATDVTISDVEFKVLLGLFMASDPTPLSSEEDDVVRDMLDRWSEQRGFDNWVVAFHSL